MVTTRTKGSSTLELLLAFAILTITLTALVSVFFGNQSVTVDTQTSTEALARASRELEKEHVLASSNYLSASSTSSTETFGGITYLLSMLVQDLTPCKKVATSTVSWNLGTLRPLSISLTTYLTDTQGTLSVGGDCFSNPPVSGWSSPTRFASEKISSTNPTTAFDVLNRIVYFGIDKAPFLAIADTNTAILNQNGGLVLTYTNGFSTTNQINSLDAISWTDPVNGNSKKYLYAAMDTSSNQLKVFDVTTKIAPALVATRNLSCVSGANPEGWFVSVYGARLYLTTRYTSGPELHIFDISTPSSPVELTTNNSGAACPTNLGYELGDTTEQFLIREQVIGGVSKKLMYLVTDEIDKEIRVLDVTIPTNITEVRSVDLPGTEDGASIYAVGSKLYVGRLSAADKEFYIYDISNPSISMNLLGSKEIGNPVNTIRVAGSFAFLALGNASGEFQVLNTSNPSNITSIATYNFGNKLQGMDYEPDFVYTTSQANPNLQILYSP